MVSLMQKNSFASLLKNTIKMKRNHFVSFWKKKKSKGEGKEAHNHTVGANFDEKKKENK